eukprot:CAMPEP_0114313242 /NCGR_PEP_ID=MMETSP0059-20121206/20979_1 /TAXON_ID=36894 /ORGANISM="Pyramimonas parkeae, Strain CCMP726" /LENGTH=68 /DNA_ID=CAMNT_0001437921 /DNA_START=356 /DNA_END=559 /DNA_ORIENTATION=+
MIILLREELAGDARPPAAGLRNGADGARQVGARGAAGGRRGGGGRGRGEPLEDAGGARGAGRAAGPRR